MHRKFYHIRDEHATRASSELVSKSQLATVLFLS